MRGDVYVIVYDLTSIDMPSKHSTEQIEWQSVSIHVELRSIVRYAPVVENL